MSDCISLLPPNSTDTERATECATARMGDIHVPTRTLWDPVNCPADMLPWLAWAFSVDRWDSQWTLEQKRNLVAASLNLHKRKGTPAAVKEAINLVLSGAEVVEPWQADDLDPHEFKIVTTGLLDSADEYDRLIKLVDAAKPVRSWLVAIQIKRSTTLPITLGGYTHTGAFLSINHTLNLSPPPQEFALACITHTSKTQSIDPISVAISLPDTEVITGGAYHIAKTTRIQPRI